MHHSNDNLLGEFEYVVYKPIPARVCFGSALERDTSPIGKNLTGFQKLFTMEPNSLSPFSYGTERYRATSTQENAPLPMLTLENGERIKFRTGARSPRFKDTILRTPSPTRYEVALTWGEINKAKHPFDSSTSNDRATYNITSIPGPGSYNAERWECRKTLTQSNFGKPISQDIIEMICVARPRHECTKCKQLCEGDYWHRDYTIFLCMLCWWEEKKTSEIYKPKELKKFNKIRNCSFMHNHEGTEAAINLLPESRLKKK
ncbi:hypothetical protein HHI36_010060 [Cryptolaemus montrouzieri]|uniref:Uncharacterized protein n=1 Tax=Cryptolaemus montrouzieri TaxID=559131 RepID=A0ABD2MHN5_9CUCU